MDAIALFVLVGMGAPLLAAVVGARVISALTNFTVNRIIMHDGGSRPSTSSSLVRYATLAVGILAANAALMEALTGLGASLLVAKILTELILIPVSFAVQRRWVFLPTQRQENPREKTTATNAPSGLRAVSYESARVEATGSVPVCAPPRYAPSSSTLASSSLGAPRFLPPVSREGGWEKQAVAPNAAAFCSRKAPTGTYPVGAL